MKPLFWTVIGLVLYVYVGYPVLLAAVRWLCGPRPVRHEDCWPLVTIMISAFNEKGVIEAKIRNCLSLDYPRELLRIVVISDASDDGTDAIVTEFARQGIELVSMPERGGKTAGLNAAMRHAEGTLVVFSDANAMYRSDAIRMLARNFADPSVGAVIGQSTYSDAEFVSEQSEGMYWRYELMVKLLESQTGSVVGGDGAIYAIRRDLYAPMPADALSDFVNPLQIVKGGFRCVFEPGAKSVERAAADFTREFRRKVRIVNRAWRATWRMKELLNPFKHGFFAVKLLSHKLLRWLVPSLLVFLAAVNLLLLDDGIVYRVALALQAVFYCLAGIGHFLRSRPVLPAVIAVPYYFCLVNLASALGIVEAFRGKTYTSWSTPRAAGT